MLQKRATAVLMLSGQGSATRSERESPRVVSEHAGANKRYRHILSAARQLTTLDDKQVDAVSARIELDLRIGYAFSRFLTLNLRPLGGPMAELILTYGTCHSASAISK